VCCLRSSLILISQIPQGVVTFKVGPDAVQIPVNSCIIQSRIGIPLLRKGLNEATTKEIILPHVEVPIFKCFLQYLYTQQLPDADLHKYPNELLALADQYNVPDLYYKMEHYLCWITQTYPASIDIINALKTAEMHNAATLKKACFATLFAYGRDLLADPAIETLPHKTVIELLRYFAQRHTEHIPPIPLPEMPQEPAAKRKRGAAAGKAVAGR
jgi:hypothetical protein